MKLRELFETIINNQNRDSIGWVPNNVDVGYNGFKVMMKPSTFLKLAAKNMGEVDLSWYIDQLRQGKEFASPFLDVSIPDDWDNEIFPNWKENSSDVTKVYSHEGRHRCLAILEVHGDIPIEVHIFNYPYKNRHFKSNPQWIEEMSKQMEAEKGGIVYNPFSSWEV
jgi:hypothetical protein